MKFFVKFSYIIGIFLLASTVFAEADIGSIDAKFCNEGIKSSMDFAVRAGDKNNVCLQFSNSSKEDVLVSFGFVDGLITSDSLQKKACSNQGNKISKYIKFDNYSKILSPGKVIQITGDLEFPLGFSGNIHACLVYNIIEDNYKTKKNKAMFDVIVRKASFVDGYVVGDFARDLQFLDDQKTNYVDFFDDSLIFVLPFANSGSLSENLIITGVLTNALGYERTSVIQKSISYGTSQIIKMSFSDIPFYKGRYSLKINAISSLPGSLDISYIPKASLKDIEYSYYIPVFLFPWKILFYVVGILLGLFLLKKIIGLFVRR